MNMALVVMAAGLGSRYGGVKQVERLGPRGEILMEYAIYDALRCGFDKLVVIIKPEMRDDVDEVFGRRVEAGSGLPIHYAVQETSGEWQGIPIPPGRTKPLGTVHALLSAREFLDRPFAAINADDFYGCGAIEAIGKTLQSLDGSGVSAMAAYRLKNTVSPFGSVTRGICAARDGYLEKVTETYKIRLFPDGSIRDTSTDGEGVLLDPDALVSMNLWAYHPDALDLFARRFETFLRELDSSDNSSECLLPVVMDEFIASGTMRCRVLHTDEHWFGLTYPEDKSGVVTELRKLHQAGVYPPVLWKEEVQNV